MRELKLDVFSLYPDMKAPGPYDYAILVDEVDMGAFACESYGAQVTNRSTGTGRRWPTSVPPASTSLWSCWYVTR